MVTTETFHHACSRQPRRRIPQVREYAAFRLRNTVRIGHELEAQFAVYWPGSLGYYVQGAVEETQTLRWYAEGLNAACDEDIEVAKKERPSDTEALPGSEAVRAAGRDSAADERRDARVHRLGPVDPSGDGRPESRVSARIDVGRGAPGSAGTRNSRRQAVAFDINDGYRLKHDVDIAVGLVNPLDWLNVLVLLRSHNFNGPSISTTNRLERPAISGSSRSASRRRWIGFITLWEMAGEVMEDRDYP